MSLSSKSKFLAYILRHDPASVGVSLECEGWCSIADLTLKTDLTMHDLEQIVQTDSKGRYSFNEGKTKIRANQGHSTQEVKISFKKAVPPIKLLHGTSSKAAAVIQKEGLKPMSRQYVHLSDDIATAEAVAGRRKGDTVIFEVDCAAMLRDGFKFFLSENGVWLVDAVPAKYLSIHTA
jgi:putative RNA 2'-phosphotransferase